jgi:hypothetical protein
MAAGRIFCKTRRTIPSCKAGCPRPRASPTYASGKSTAGNNLFVCSQHRDSIGNQLDRRNLRMRFKVCRKVLGRERQGELTIHDGWHSYVSQQVLGFFEKQEPCLVNVADIIALFPELILDSLPQ